MGTVVVNAVGEQCPIPVVKATRALREMAGPGILEVHVDNEIAVQNLTRMAAALEEPPLSCTPDARGSLVVAVDSAVMGHGSDELGRVLMKGFLFAIGQLPELPKVILFYNGGAHLTCRGSDSLEDLKSLEAQGVEILTCGTCLNHYGLTEELAVGGVTNMYSIVEKLAGAGKVVKP